MAYAYTWHTQTHTHTNTRATTTTTTTYDHGHDCDNDNDDDHGNDNDYDDDGDAQPILMEGAPVPHVDNRTRRTNPHDPADSPKMKNLSVGLSDNLHLKEKSSSSCSPIRDIPLKAGEMLEMTSASSGSLIAVTEKMKDRSVGPQRSDEPPHPLTSRDSKAFGNHYHTQNLQTPTFTDNLPETIQKNQRPIRSLSAESCRRDRPSDKIC